jgi:hypothetical protein
LPEPSAIDVTSIAPAPEDFFGVASVTSIPGPVLSKER